MRHRLTDKLVRELDPPAKGNRITYDSETRGFGIRITSRGTKSFVLNYRANGRERRFTIGAYPDWSVAAVREEAKRLKREIYLGLDPMEKRDEARRAPSVADLAERYVEEHLPRKRPSSQRNDLSILERIVVPKLGRLRVADVRHGDIDSLHRSLKDTPYRANRVVALLSKMFNLAIKWDWRADNPAKGIERFPEERRVRYLTQEEIARLTKALSDHPNQIAANAIRFLLLTGARRGEVIQATWEELDLERGVWVKPSAHTKQRREHRVPLSAAAVALLQGMRRTSNSAFVFPGRRPETALQDLKKSWKAIRRKASLENVRLHDLRHTYASILASSGLSLPIIGALLGHTQPNTTARYSHLFDDPLREATEHVGTLLNGL